MLFISLGTIGMAQDKIKYQGATFPLGAYWEVLVNEPDIYFKSKMKGEDVFWFVQYLGENLSGEEATESSVRFLKALKLDMSNFNSQEMQNIKIGKRGVAARINWQGKNKNDQDANFFAYLYKSAEKKGRSQYFIMVYEEACRSAGDCNKYQLHRENYEKSFEVR